MPVGDILILVITGEVITTGTGYGTFALECLLFWGFLSAQLLLGPPRPRILRCFQICAQNWQQPSGTEVVAVQSWGPGPIK